MDSRNRRSARILSRVSDDRDPLSFAADRVAAASGAVVAGVETAELKGSDVHGLLRFDYKGRGLGDVQGKILCHGMVAALAAYINGLCRLPCKDARRMGVVRMEVRQEQGHDALFGKASVMHAQADLAPGVSGVYEHGPVPAGKDIAVSAASRTKHRITNHGQPLITEKASVFRMPLFSGEGPRSPDRSDMSRLLYQLSYAAKSLIL